MNSDPTSSDSFSQSFDDIGDSIADASISGLGSE